jgi:hypothetical protein
MILFPFALNNRSSSPFVDIAVPINLHVFLLIFVVIYCTSLQNIKISRHFLCSQLILDQQEIYSLRFNIFVF